MKAKLNFKILGNSSLPILVLIHGIGASSSAFWQQVKYFQGKYQIYLIDLPGHGGSSDIPWINMETTVKQVADCLPDDATIHMAGISLGGHVVLDLVKSFPKKISSAFISGITTKPMGPSIFKLFLPLALESYDRVRSDPKRIGAMINEYKIPLDYKEKFIEDFMKVKKETYAAVFDDLYSFRMDSSYSYISCPILFVATELEEKGIRDTLKYAPTIITHAETALIDNAQHQWPVQMPQLFNNFLEKWLLKNS